MGSDALAQFGPHHLRAGHRRRIDCLIQINELEASVYLRLRCPARVIGTREAMMRANRLLKFVVLVVPVTVSVIMTTALRSASADDATEKVLAAQIRDQGYRCEKPLGAKSDEALSKPDEAVWVLRCEAATYRMRLVPDMAAKVEKLD